MKLYGYICLFLVVLPMQATSQKVAGQIIAIYQQATDDYIGESVSQLEHALQVGQQALYCYGPEEGVDDEVVLAAFLHDIGHRYLGVETQGMAGYGVLEHEKVGAEFVKKCGFSSKIVALIAGHVDAKRYLVFKEPGYYERLSEASKQTLQFQGGAMSAQEAAVFEQNPYFKQILLLRRWEELAKVPGVTTVPLAFFKALILRHLESNQRHI